ncbi:MAG: NAD(P)H-dependent oxidoreductase [Methylotenera sp.]|nr:NAD(P)H-dependent oxidoreductase [Oligoflexia bacterium]
MATAQKSRPVITLVNGSLGGSSGNTARLLSGLLAELNASCEVRALHLAETVCSAAEIQALLGGSDGFVFATGTYWDSWGSPLQRFLEDATDWEASDLWLGKPAAVVVSMHSVGGKEVLSRLQGVLSTLGVLIPPMSGMTYSLANHLALQSREKDHQADLWQLDDLKCIAHNLVIALELRAAQRESKKADWQSWPIDSSDPKRIWLK